MSKIELSEQEFAALINMSDRENYLPVTFGGGVFLQADMASKQILQRLQEMRAARSPQETAASPTTET